MNGSFGGDIPSTVEGSEITYQCDDGLTPEGTMTAVCGEDGEWRPNPGDVECRSTTEGSKFLCALVHDSWVGWFKLGSCTYSIPLLCAAESDHSFFCPNMDDFRHRICEITAS